MNDKSPKDDFEGLRTSGWNAIGKTSEVPQIADIHDKARDLIASLHAAGFNKEAEEIVQLARAFKSPTEVRRAILSLQQRLELWRTKRVLPGTINIEFEAQQLEDACRVILGLGDVKNYFEPVSALVSSPIDRLKHYSQIALRTFFAFGAVAGIPMALIALGVDWTTWGLPNETEPIRVAQGQETSAPIRVLERTKLPKQTLKVEVSPADRCAGSTYRDFFSWKAWACAMSPRKLATDGSPTYEMTQKGQYHGVLFAITDTKLVEDSGSAIIRLFAKGTTPPGIYKIPLEASYRGYRMKACWGIDFLGKCNPPIADPAGKDTGLKVPILIVRVAGAKSTAEVALETIVEKQESEIARRRAVREQSALRQHREVLAGRILDAMSDLEMIRKCLAQSNWSEARSRLDAVTTKHDELSKLIMNGGDATAFRNEMANFQYVRDEQHAALGRFEDQVMEAIIPLIFGSEMDDNSRTSALPKVAKRFDISAQYAHRIYTNHSGEVQLRLKQLAEQQAAKDAAIWQAAQSRCGTPPLQAAVAVDKYLRRLLNDPTGKVDECSPPQFSKKECWTVTCWFGAEDQRGTPRKLKWTFYLIRDEVTRHRQ